MRRQFIAYTLADPRDGTVFFAGYGPPTQPGILLRRAGRGDGVVRPTMAATMRDARIADIVAGGAEPVVGVLLRTESRGDAARQVAEAVTAHGLSVQLRERPHRPSPVVGVPLTTKAVALLLLREEGPLYARLLVDRAAERWSIDVVAESARVALLGLETGGCVESHIRPNDALVGHPRTWYALTPKGERAAERVRETLRAVAA